MGRQRPACGDEEGTGACRRDLAGAVGGGVQRGLEAGSGGPRKGAALQALSADPPQVLLQVLIIITGNYNFFNLLTLLLTTALLDDAHLAARSGDSRRKKTPTCECQPVPDRQPSSALLPARVLPAPPKGPCSSSTPAPWP